MDIKYEPFDTFRKIRNIDMTPEIVTSFIKSAWFQEELRYQILELKQSEAEGIIMQSCPVGPGYFLLYPESKDRLLKSVGLKAMTKKREIGLRMVNRRNTERPVHTNSLDNIQKGNDTR